jgi:hypothetical protein
MPKRSSKPRDLNALAASIIADSTDEDERQDEPADDGKDPAAVALGRKGGLKRQGAGGEAHARGAQRGSAEGRSSAMGITALTLCEYRRYYRRHVHTT